MESAVTISAARPCWVRSARARATARSLLPPAVGPAMTGNLGGCGVMEEVFTTEITESTEGETWFGPSYLAFLRALRVLRGDRTPRPGVRQWGIGAGVVHREGWAFRDEWARRGRWRLPWDAWAVVA